MGYTYYYNNMDKNYKIHNANCIEKLEEMEDESVHAIVCDPPYGLGFMGNSWDEFEPKEYQEWTQEWGEKAKDVLKPGGHLLCFSGNRTHHRAFTGLEDAGFNIRDTLTWHYGQGFPTGQDIGKSIDRWHTDSEDEREVVDTGRNGETAGMDELGEDGSSGFTSGEYEITTAGSSLAKKWDGWNTQLKPATEFIALAQKPLSEDAIYKNVIEHEVGGLNIDRCRVPVEDDDNTDEDDGRYPANLLLSLLGQKILDNITDDAKSSKTSTDNAGYGASDVDYGNNKEDVEFDDDRGYEDSGGKSRYFMNFSEPLLNSSDNTDDGRYPANLLLSYNAKLLMDYVEGESATGSVGGDNNEEGDNSLLGHGGVTNDSNVYSGETDRMKSRFFNQFTEPRFNYETKASQSERTHDGNINNSHPTVKPVDLMEWLVRLVTKEDHIVLDPFMGSGTTGLATLNQNRKFIGIEKDTDYYEIAESRIQYYNKGDQDG